MIEGKSRNGGPPALLAVVACSKLRLARDDRSSEEARRAPPPSSRFSCVHSWLSLALSPSTYPSTPTAHHSKPLLLLFRPCHGLEGLVGLVSLACLLNKQKEEEAPGRAGSIRSADPTAAQAEQNKKKGGGVVPLPPLLHLIACFQGSAGLLVRVVQRRGCLPQSIVSG